MRQHTLKFGVGVLALLCSARLSPGDAVILKNGSRIEGDVKRTESGWTVTAANGKTTDVGADDVRTIEVSSATRPAASVADANLASLRRSSEALTSPATALERYRRFLEQNSGTPSIDDARHDMAIWQDRLNRGLIKVGTQWMTPAEKATMAQQASSIAEQAVDLLKQGRTNEAEPVIQQAIDADPQNPTALFLRGVMLFDQGQMVPARKAFESVVASLAWHAPSYNDLAVILWKQNQQMGALRFYEQAITAKPVDKVLLDNLAEALAALPDDQRRNPLAVRLYKRFTDQDAQLQAIMAQTGWHRWGSTWVDQPTLDKLKIAEQDVKDKLDKLSADMDAAKAQIATINSSIDSNTRSMTQMQADTYTRDTKGNIIQLPLPSLYLTMQQDNEKLTAERAQQEAKIQSIQQNAKKVQQSMPVPQFTGVQRLIGVEGAPFPTTAPTTSPAAAATLPSTLQAPIYPLP